MMFAAETKEALLELQKILHCRKCDQPKDELLSLGNCRHWFCRSCATSSAGQLCPICGVHSEARKTRVDVQLSEVTSLCSQMMAIINGRAVDPLSPCKDGEESLSEQLREGDRSTEVENMDVKSTPGLSVSISESIESPSFVKLRSRRKCTTETVSSIPNIFDKMSDLLTHEPRKRKSLTPKSSGKRMKKATESTASGSEPATPSEQKTTTRTTKRSHSSKDTSYGIDHNEVLSAVTRKSTPQSTKKKQLESRSSKDASYDMDDNDVLSTVTRKSTPQSTKKKQLESRSSKDASYDMDDNDVLSTVTRRSTPQSTKKRQQSKLCKRNAKGESLLHVNTIKKNIDEVKRLLDDGANPNVKDNAGWTPLHEAVCGGDFNMAALLIANGVSVNAPGMDNSTPLHEAVVYELSDCVQLLIENGADIFCRDLHGRSPIDIAQGRIKELLLQATQSRVVSEVDVSLLNESSKPLCFAGSNLDLDQSKLLSQYSKTFQAKIVKEVTSEVTHLLVNVNKNGSSPRTYKYLSAMVSGKWIVDLQWLKLCCQENKRMSEEQFEVSGCTFYPKSGAPRKALENRLKQLPPLLDGCQVFFHKLQTPMFSKDELTNLVKQGGGVVLKREPHLHNLDDYPYTHPYHAQSSASLADCTIYIIYDDANPDPPSVQATRMACLPVSWLVDSISTFSLLDKDAYVKIM